MSSWRDNAAQKVQYDLVENPSLSQRMAEQLSEAVPESRTLVLVSHFNHSE